MTLEEAEALLATMPEMTEVAAAIRALREEVFARRAAIDPNGGVVDMAAFEADVHARTRELKRLLIDALKARQAELQGAAAGNGELAN